MHTFVPGKENQEPFPKVVVGGCLATPTLLIFDLFFTTEGGGRDSIASNSVQTTSYTVLLASGGCRGWWWGSYRFIKKKLALN